jgi:hypothetical protein
LRRENAASHPLFDRLNQNSNQAGHCEAHCAEAIQTILADEFWIASLRSQ